MNNISITPGANNVGAYINNVNLKNLNKNQIEEIKNTLNQFGVIFIKEQNLDSESYQSFAKSFGQPIIYPRLKGLDKKYPFIRIRLRIRIIIQMQIRKERRQINTQLHVGK